MACACFLWAAGAWAEAVEVLFWNQTGKTVKIQPYTPPDDLHKPSANVYGRLLGAPRELLADSDGTTHDRTLTIPDSLIAVFEMRFEAERCSLEGMDSDFFLMKVTPEGGGPAFHLIFTGLMEMEEKESKVTCEGNLAIHDLAGRSVDVKAAVPGLVFSFSAKGRVLCVKPDPEIRTEGKAN